MRWQTIASRRFPAKQAVASSRQQACGSPARSSSVVFVDESDVLAVDSGEGFVGSLSLTVEINGEGKLSLNRIDTGTIGDTTILRDKLKAIFEDRQKESVDERGIFVEMNGTVWDAKVLRIPRSVFTPLDVHMVYIGNSV